MGTVTARAREGGRASGGVTDELISGTRAGSRGGATPCSTPCTTPCATPSATRSIRARIRRATRRGTRRGLRNASGASGSSPTHRRPGATRPRSTFAWFVPFPSRHRRAARPDGLEHATPRAVRAAPRWHRDEHSPLRGVLASPGGRGAAREKQVVTGRRGESRARRRFLRAGVRVSRRGPRAGEEAPLLWISPWIRRLRSKRARLVGSSRASSFTATSPFRGSGRGRRLPGRPRDRGGRNDRSRKRG